MVKALLDAVGFDVTLENVLASQQSARLFSGDFEIIIGGKPTVASSMLFDRSFIEP